MSGKIIVIANNLDQLGLYNEADEVDKTFHSLLETTDPTTFNNRWQNMEEFAKEVVESEDDPTPGDKYNTVWAEDLLDTKKFSLWVCSPMLLALEECKWSIDKCIKFGLKNVYYQIEKIVFDSPDMALWQNYIKFNKQELQKAYRYARQIALNNFNKESSNYRKEFYNIFERFFEKYLVYLEQKNNE